MRWGIGSRCPKDNEDCRAGERGKRERGRAAWKGCMRQELGPIKRQTHGGWVNERPFLQADEHEDELGSRMEAWGV